MTLLDTAIIMLITGFVLRIILTIITRNINFYTILNAVLPWKKYSIAKYIDLMTAFVILSFTITLLVQGWGHAWTVVGFLLFDWGSAYVPKKKREEKNV